MIECLFFLKLISSKFDSAELMRTLFPKVSTTLVIVASTITTTNLKFFKQNNVERECKILKVEFFNFLVLV